MENASPPRQSSSGSCTRGGHEWSYGDALALALSCAQSIETDLEAWHRAPGDGLRLGHGDGPLNCAIDLLERGLRGELDDHGRLRERDRIAFGDGLARTTRLLARVERAMSCQQRSGDPKRELPPMNEVREWRRACGMAETRLGSLRRPSPAAAKIGSPQHVRRIRPHARRRREGRRRSGTRAGPAAADGDPEPAGRRNKARQLRPRRRGVRP